MGGCEETIVINGVRLWYRRTGDGRRPVLVVQPPGWGLGSAYLQRAVAPLEQDFDVVYYDTRGSGRSAAPAAARDTHVGAMVEDLEALRIRLELNRFSLLGHSHGAYVALRYAIHHGSCLDRLLVVSPQLDPEDAAADVARNLPRAAADARLAPAAKAWAELATLRSDAEFAAWWSKVLPLYFHSQERHQACAWDLELSRASLAVAASVFGSDGQFRVAADLHRIRIPTLVVVGRHDFITSPEQAQKVHQGIAGSQLAVLERSGHFPWLEEPEALLAAVRRFLA